MSYDLNSFTISDYVNSVANPIGLFRTIRINDYQMDANSQPRIWCGNNAVIFNVLCNNERKMMKCYFKPCQRTEQILEYINSIPPSPYIRREQWLKDEIYIYNIAGRGDYRDVLLAEWVDGKTLEYEIRKAAICNDKERIEELAEEFRQLSLWLLAQPWAHGDIKPDNILVCNGKMKLIDYDAAYIPECEGEQTEEIGTPGFQHPKRNTTFYNKHIDDYPIALIATLLYGIGLDSTLFDQKKDGDLCLLSPSEVISGKSIAFDKIVNLFASSGKYTLYRLATTLRSQTPEIGNLATILSDIGSTNLPPITLELSEKSGKWGYVDQNNNIVIPHIYENALEFHEGFAAVKLHGTWQFIDSIGNLRLRCDGMEKIKNFKEGLAAVCINSKWGYININGNVMIEPKFEIAYSMSNGKAKVKFNGNYIYISKEGKWLENFDDRGSETKI